MEHKQLTHVCTGCGAEQMLAPDRKHYHDCNPSAPFVFMVKSDRELAAQVVAASAAGRAGEEG